MVVLQVKRSDEFLFLYETPVVSDLCELIPTIAKLNCLRLRVGRLVSAAEDLMQYGPMKPDNQQGYTEEQLEELSTPEFKRHSKPLTEEHLSKTILKESVLLEAIEQVRGAVTIIFPEGLPVWDPVREILEDKEDLTGTAASKEVIDPAEASLWWANKELLRDRKLSDFVGKNDKTKIIVKIQKRGQGPPLREPPITEQQQKEMMAYYYRKQEQQKKLAENDEDEYLNSSWADPKSLKSSFNGVQNVKWKPF
eukprot:jgi/Hompol1/1912/HPOL_000227-RA